MECKLLKLKRFAKFWTLFRRSVRKTIKVKNENGKTHFYNTQSSLSLLLLSCCLRIGFFCTKSPSPFPFQLQHRKRNIFHLLSFFCATNWAQQNTICTISKCNGENGCERTHAITFAMHNNRVIVYMLAFSSGYCYFYCLLNVLLLLHSFLFGFSWDFPSF